MYGRQSLHPVGAYTAAAHLAFAAAGEPEADCDQLFQHAGQLTNARGALDQKLPFTHGIARKVPEERGGGGSAAAAAQAAEPEPAAKKGRGGKAKEAPAAVEQ